MTGRLVALAVAVTVVLGCATNRVPRSLRGYDVVVQGSDELSRELARAMKEYGYHVRPRLRGGSRPTAALIHFLYSDPGPDQPTWLHVRLADTRTGVIVGAGMIQLDSLTPTVRSRANAAVLAISAP